MTLRKSWPVAILFGAALFYFWSGEDEPLPTKQTQQEQLAESPAKIAPRPALQPPPMWDAQGRYQAPAATPGSSPYGYNQPAQNGRFQTPQSDQSYFRPYDRQGNRNQSYPDPYGRPTENLPYAMPAPEFQDYSGRGNLQAPNNITTYRFRPQDEKRQSRRWEGNYARKPVPRYQPPNPSPYDNNYAPPLNQAGPAAEPSSLWANSWPQR